MFPKLFQFGDFFLPAYGVLVALGVLAGLQVSTILARRRGLDPEKISNLVVLCALAGLAGAKVAMLAGAMQQLLSAGYVYIGMDHFALHHDSLAVAKRQIHL